MDKNLYYFSLIDEFYNYYCYILNNIDYYDKSVINLLRICYIISDLNNSVSSPGLLLVDPINYRI